MEFDSTSSFLWLAMMVMAVFPMLMTLFYFLDTARGVYAWEFKVYNTLAYWLFLLPLGMCVVLWLTTDDINEKLLHGVEFITCGWLVMALLGLVVSLFTSVAEKCRSIRETIAPCFLRAMITALTIWLFF